MAHPPPKVRLFGVPTSAGCLYEGTELTPEHLRKHEIVGKLRSVNPSIEDLGDVTLPKFPRHNDCPIRNYPAPKTVWDQTANFLRSLPQANDRELFLCLGGDCSIVVGTVAGMAARFGRDRVHIFYIDGDVDSIAPGDQAFGSAGMGLWLLTQESQYYDGLKMLPTQITVIGNKEPPKTDVGIPSVSLSTLRERGVVESTRAELAKVSTIKNIFVHFDVDVLSQESMPAAYAPRKDGLSWDELRDVLVTLFADERVRFFEITEFCPPKDVNGIVAKQLIDAIVEAYRMTL